MSNSTMNSQPSDRVLLSCCLEAKEAAHDVGDVQAEAWLGEEFVVERTL